jgi:glycosyltransferase involved in cell wall biosynthesis
MKFSLIIATLGRKKELSEVLLSLQNSEYDIRKLEIIIVDQNEKGFLDTILLKFKNLNIKYIHSNVRGLSYNRNIGLKYATNDIICFPDDDCEFYEDTLSEVSQRLLDAPIDFCMGRIYNREKQENIIKKWPKKELVINRFNSYFINSSITLFIKKESILYFDENLGVGANFGSCEDADLIYRLLENNNKGIYTPKIELWHPQLDYKGVSLERVKSYASGFGYFVRKKTDAIKLLLLFLLLGKKILQLIKNLFNRKFKKGYFKYFFKGLVLGLK